MAGVWSRLAAPASYRRLAYLLSALVLGHAWFIVLVVGWSLCLSVLITPLVIPFLIGLAAAVRGCAQIEASLARGLLDTRVRGPRFPPRGIGFWRYMGAMLGGPFWRSQAYLLVRWFVGVPVAAILIALLAASLGMIFAPAWVPFVDGGVHVAGFHAHTLARSLVFVPVGLVLLPASILIASALGRPSAALASRLLESGESTDALTAPARPNASGPAARASRRRGLGTHAAADSALLAALLVIWAATSRGYFWPVWVCLPLAMALAIHAWFVLLAERPPFVERVFGSRTLAGYVGVCVAAELYLIGVWAVSGAGYFWPVWPLLGMAAVAGVQVAAAALGSPRQTALAERIDTLEASRAGAVDVQESELRRIERDLHDGAQARLVALGMSLGMAEHTIAEDPRRAGELLAEARVGAEEALRELRRLARGIHPPVLSDRGLEAAIAALASSTPLPVTLSVELSERPPAVVESAAYFVVAEALANAGKHAGATRVQIAVRRVGDALELTVTDDGCGGADPEGGGLRGLRRRVEALDGTLGVTSPRGGPTTIRAELPCGW